MDDRTRSENEMNLILDKHRLNHCGEQPYSPTQLRAGPFKIRWHKSISLLQSH